MEKVVLNAELREETGKTRVKELRGRDMVPAVVYKKGKDSLNIKVNTRNLFQVLHTTAGENVLITLKIKGEKGHKEKTCIVKEVQKHPVKENILHVDLKEISLTEKIKVKVPVHPHGEPEGVVADEGVLDHVLWEIEVECLPAEIPEKIEIEVAHMKIGDTVYVKDLVVPPAVKVLSDPELTVLSISPPAKEEVVEEAVEGEETAEPEVISKGKKEEEEEEAEEAPKEAKEREKPKKEQAPPAKGEKKDK